MMRNKIFTKSLALLLGVFATSGLMAQYVTTLSGSSTQQEGFNSGTVDRFSALYNHPYGVAEDTSGNLYISDYYNFNVRLLYADDIYIRAGKAGDPSINGPGHSDQSGIQARFAGPAGMDIAPNGTVYIADESNNCIRTISKFISLGNAQSVGTLTGTFQNALFLGPRDVAIHQATGDIYISDNGSDRILKWTASTQTVSVFAGSTAGYANGTAGNAKFFSPNGIAFDASGNYLFVADAGNNLIRKIQISNANVTDVAGVYQTSGSADGPGAQSAVNTPGDFALSSNGTLFFTDGQPGNMLRAIINPVSAPVVKTMAGKHGLEIWDATTWKDGQDTAARFYNPMGITFNKAKNILYVADRDNHSIRKIQLTPIAIFSVSDTTTITGTAGKITLTSTSLNKPDSNTWTITPNTFQFSDGTNAFSATPNVFFTDSGKYTVTLKVKNQFGSETLTKTNHIIVTGNPIIPGGINDPYNADQVMIYPNPSNGRFNIRFADVKVKSVNVYDVSGRMISSAPASGLEMNVNLENLEKGFYLVELKTDKNSVTKKILIQ